MKGSPLLRALLAFVVIALMGVPLLKVTNMRSAVAAPAQVETAAARIPLRLTFSTVPQSFAILHLGVMIWTEKTPTMDVTKTLALAYPKEGVDLLVKVTWPADAEAAVRLRLSDPDGNEHDKTVWGRGEMEEVITFP